MDKKEYLRELADALGSLPKKEIENSVGFYSEMIDDRIESGMSEAEAIKDLGAPTDAAREIRMNMPLPTLIRSEYKKRKPKRSLRVSEILLIVLGSPIWISLLAVAFSLLLSVYIVIWSLYISLWAADITLFGSGIAGIITFFSSLIASPAYAFLQLGVGLFALGLCIPMFFICVKSFRYFVKFNVQIIKFIKKIIVGRNN